MSSFVVIESISYLLTEVCKLRRTLSEQMLSEIGLHAGQEMFFVSLLAEAGLTQSELAERLHIQRATLTNMLNRLEQHGLIERRGDPEDQRILRIYPTDKSRDLRDRLQAIWEEVEIQTVQGLSAEERIIFRRLLLQVYQNLSR